MVSKAHTRSKARSSATVVANESRQPGRAHVVFRAKSVKAPSSRAADVSLSARRSPKTKARSQKTTSGRRSRGAGICLSERDLALLYELLTARYLTTPQIEALFWRTGRSERGRRYACQRRLKLLSEQGLMRRIELPVMRGKAQKPFIYCLDEKGANLLIAELGVDPSEIDWKPKSAEANYPFLAHLLATNDLRIHLAQACERQQVSLSRWVNEKELKSEGMKDYVTLVSPDGQKRQQAAVVPDACFALQVDSKLGHFFVEVDMGTVTIQPTVWEKRGWNRKVRAFLAYYASGKFQQRYGNKAFRVLCITTSQQRLENLKATTEKAKGGQMFWFSTFEKLTPETFLSQPVWIRAGEDAPIAILG
jgi:hypothetical protein